MKIENDIYLKPCPFCGDSGFSVIKEGSIYVVQCGSCLCKTGATTEKEVIEYWNGRPIEDVSFYLGHKNIQTTYKHYAKFAPNYLRKAANVLNDVIG